MTPPIRIRLRCRWAANCSGETTVSQFPLFQDAAWAVEYNESIDSNSTKYDARLMVCNMSDFQDVLYLKVIRSNNAVIQRICRIIDLEGKSSPFRKTEQGEVRGILTASSCSWAILS